jgi:acyl carrier protein
VSTIAEVNTVLDRTLQLGGRSAKFDGNTGLFGSIAEFDSMAVVAVVAALEEKFGITVEDDEITADVFETVGSLVRFVDDKIRASR